MFGKKNTEVKISTLIGRGSELQGDFKAAGSARVDGKVNGNVTVEGTLIVGSTGAVSGNVEAEAVLIGGEVTGDIIAPSKAELTETAKVWGDVTTAVIVIDEHAVFQGRCNMNQEVPEKKAKPNNAKAARVGKRSAKAAIEEALKEVHEEELKEAREAEGEESALQE